VRLYEIKNNRKVIALYEQDFFLNIWAINLIFNLEPPDLHLFVDNPEEPRGVIVNEGGYFWHAYSPDKNLSLGMLDGLPWGDREFGFAGIPEYQAQHLRRRRQVVWENPCYLYVLTEPEKFSGEIVAEIEELTPDCVQLVSDVWPHGGHGDGRLTYLHDCIKKGPTAAIYQDDRPIAFALVHSDGSMGILHTEPEFREQGWGRLVSTALVRKLLDLDQPVFCYILRDNLASINLTESMGLTRIAEVSWMGVT
jgi:ribosomal protein S18 acetylase RimI-like enzyme